MKRLAVLVGPDPSAVDPRLLSGPLLVFLLLGLAPGDPQRLGLGVERDGAHAVLLRCLVVGPVGNLDGPCGDTEPRSAHELVADVLNEAQGETAIPIGTYLRDCGSEAHTQIPDREVELDSEPTPASHPETGDDPVDTSNATAPQGDEGADTTESDESQETADASPTIDAQEPGGEEVPVGSAAPSMADGAPDPPPGRP
ncbi:hypothetical protein ACIBG6_11970 [Streptomyces sp. NPDC050842]|uniref:hypothetical protein n=1 Tax=Streptomyces sp. NPDC050842 TaxID=3365636 RepID=UPI0037A1FEB5